MEALPHQNQAGGAAAAAALLLLLPPSLPALIALLTASEPTIPVSAVEEQEVFVPTSDQLHQQQHHQSELASTRQTTTRHQINRHKKTQHYRHQHNCSSTDSKQSILQMILFIFALLFVSHFGCATATPVPSIGSPAGSSSSKQEITGENGDGANSLTGITKPPISQQQQQLGGVGAPASGDLRAPSQNGIGGVKGNTAEKLKRGLTNFMNQLNPAPFFVPTLPEGHATKGSSASLLSADKQQSAASPPSSAEPATIVNSEQSSLVLKGPANRWAFARPIGGPLRWGRRRR